MFKLRFRMALTTRSALQQCNSSSVSTAPTGVSRRLELSKSCSCAGDALTDTQLLSVTNRERCIEKLQQVAAFQRSNKTDSTDNRNGRRENAAYASVLIPLCTTNGSNDVSLLYTRRAATLRRHRLQTSFPGGLRDEVDSDYIDCALRETQEEIGLPRERIEVWGHGTLMHMPRTAAIMPVVGVIRDLNLNELQLNASEVDDAFTVPIGSMITPMAARHTQFKKGGYSGPVFKVDQHHIWGITGYLTFIFLRCLLPPVLVDKYLANSLKYVRPYKVPTTRTTR